MSQNPGNAPFFVDNEVITLTRNGVWIADGTEITHEPTRKLFARSLQREGDGWILSIGMETKSIHVEDTAYFVVRVEKKNGACELLLSDETREPLQAETLRYRPGRLTCLIKGQHEAKFLHAPYFDLLQGLEEDSDHYFLKIGGQRINLAQKENGNP
jgi:hypothetical protein